MAEKFTFSRDHIDRGIAYKAGDEAPFDQETIDLLTAAGAGEKSKPKAKPGKFRDYQRTE